MRKYTMLIPAAVLTCGLAACSGGGGEAVQADKQAATQSQQKHAAPAKTKQQPTPEQTPSPTKLKVPTDLVGKTLGLTKGRLAEIGFTHVVIAGGEVTDADPVASVPKAGETIADDAKLVVVGDAPEPVVPETLESDEDTGDQSSQGGPSTTADLPPSDPNSSWHRPPEYGYQCRPGDAERYDVCAGHKAWVEGQPSASSPSARTRAVRGTSQASPACTKTTEPPVSE